MATSFSPRAFSVCTDTGISLTVARDLPLAEIVRLIRQSAVSEDSSPRASVSSCSVSQVTTSGSASSENVAVISALLAPCWMRSVLARAPRIIPSASSRMDFPAPVSPVSAVMPLLNSSSDESIIANCLMCRLVSTALPSAPIQFFAQDAVVVVLFRM